MGNGESDRGSASDIEILEDYREACRRGSFADPVRFFRERVERPDPVLQERLEEALLVEEGLSEIAKELVPHGRTENSVGSYRLLTQIGRGGMGSVFLAIRPGTDDRYAVKLLARPLELSWRRRKRFRREAELAGRLAHPHIVPVLDYGVCDGRPFLVMKYVEGESLEEAIKRSRQSFAVRNKQSRTGAGFGRKRDCATSVSGRPATMRGSSRISIAWVMEIVASVAEALDYAHGQDVIHRDVKPGNILLDRQGKVQLADFGLARELQGDNITRTGELAASYPYMSPEQASANRAPLDHRTDVFSLGAVLFELVTHEPAFPGNSLQDIYKAVLFRDPPLLRRERPDTPQGLEAICRKALEKNPDHRYQSAGAMAADLRRLQRFRPVLVPCPGPARRFARRLRRRPALAATFGVSSLAIVCLSGLLSYSLVSASQLRKRHIQQFEQLVVDGATHLRMGRPQDALTLLRGAAQIAPLTVDRNEVEALITSAVVARDEEQRKEREREADQVARRLVARGQELLHSIQELDAETRKNVGRLRALEHRIRGPESPQAKKEVWQLQSWLDRASEKRDILRVQLQQTLASPPALERTELASRLLTDFYFREMERSESIGDWDQARVNRAQVERFDDESRYSERLRRPGRLNLRTNPAGASVHVFKYVDRDLRMWPVPFDPSGSSSCTNAPLLSVHKESGQANAADDGYVAPSVHGDLKCNSTNELGLTPLEEMVLPSGSYLLVLRKPGFVTVRYPIFVTRERNLEPRDPIRLFAPEEHPGLERWVQIPGGECFLGSGKTKRRGEVRSFFMSRFEVTIAEYSEFLHDPETLKRFLAERAGGRLALAPREARNAGMIWPFDDSTRRFSLPEESGIPVIGISFEDALDYADWLDGEVQGPFQIRLPTDRQWARAAQGADGRAFPWGDGFDPTFAKTERSRRSQAQPEPVGTFPCDESPFGVQDLAGGVSEWCLDWDGSLDRYRVVRGGSWTERDPVPSWSRSPTVSSIVRSGLGIRLVCIPRSRRKSDLEGSGDGLARFADRKKDHIFVSDFSGEETHYYSSPGVRTLPGGWFAERQETGEHKGERTPFTRLIGGILSFRGGRGHGSDSIEISRVLEAVPSSYVLRIRFRRDGTPSNERSTLVLRVGQDSFHVEGRVGTGIKGAWSQELELKTGIWYRAEIIRTVTTAPRKITLKGMNFSAPQISVDWITIDANDDEVSEFEMRVWPDGANRPGKPLVHR